MLWPLGVSCYLLSGEAGKYPGSWDAEVNLLGTQR